eukprot:gene9109-10681_t
MRCFYRDLIEKTRKKIARTSRDSAESGCSSVYPHDHEASSCEILRFVLLVHLGGAVRNLLDILRIDWADRSMNQTQRRAHCQTALKRVLLHTIMSGLLPLTGYTEVTTEAQLQNIIDTTPATKAWVLYFTKANCVACDTIKTQVLSWPAKFPTVAFYHITIPSTTGVGDHVDAMGINILPAFKIFKNYAVVDNHIEWIQAAYGDKMEAAIVANK